MEQPGRLKDKIRPNNKDLLELEQKKSSSLESALLVCKKNSLSKFNKPHTSKKLMTAQFRRVKFDVQEKSCTDYDIEVLTGNETQYIEMDLMLGIANLHTPEAVEAAESAMAGSQPIHNLSPSSSESDSDDSSDKSTDDNYNADENADISSLSKSQKPNLDGGESLGGDQPKKRPKIIELK